MTSRLLRYTNLVAMVLVTFHIMWRGFLHFIWRKTFP
jgi:hypothetical protein